ncbi:unnamed protein product [Notodromas monacha]|uniref:Uncharacterized protein n=1 Tax=Notodromas monacha TaxID=399045 RepID=A0A7R9BY76_9CRUS|nr:unnamed protein product [Notodromas monacha]CAG0922440.1 unnamed protein product [Notodromas monacha]
MWRKSGPRSVSTRGGRTTTQAGGGAKEHVLRRTEADEGIDAPFYFLDPTKREQWANSLSLTRGVYFECLITREALEKQHVAMRKAVEEAKKKEGLKKEVKELDKLSFKAEKDRVRVVQAALDKCAEVEEECRKKHETVENLKSNIGELKATKSGLEKDIREICGEKEDLIKLMDSLQRDRDRLMEKINRLTENVPDLARKSDNHPYDRSHVPLSPNIDGFPVRDFDAERDLLSELNRLTSRSQDLSSTRKGYMFETASTCGSEDDRKYLTDISKSLSSLKTKTGRFETGESVSRLKREVTSLRYENTQLQAERDRLRRMLGLPGAGSPVNGVVPLSEAKTKDRYSPVEQETRPNVMRSTTKHPFSGFTVTTNIETTTIPRDTPAVRTQAVGGEQTIVTGGSSSATKPSVLESTERLANAAEPSALVSPPRASPNATADSGFDYRCSASSDHRITDSQENMRGEMKGSERNFESHTGRSYAGVPSKNVAWCDEIIPTSGRFRADLDDAKAMIDALKEELNACQRERDSLRQEKFDMKFLNDTLLSDLERQKKANERLEEDNRIQYKIATESGPPSIATQAMIKRLEREKQNLQTEVTALKLDRDRLRDRLKVASDAARTERMQSQNQTEALKLKIASLERNHGEILSREASQKSMTNNFRDQVMSLQRELTITRTELSQQRAAANQLKLLCEEKERRVEKLEVEGVGLHRQLASAEKKLETCCKENGALKAEMQTLQGQLARTRSFVDTVSKEKDSLSNQLDDRDVAIDKERSERAKLMDEIRKLQSTLSSTQSTLDKTLAECDSREVELNSVRRHMQQLTKELEAANMSRQGAFQEGKRLQGDLTTAITDIRSIKQELDKCKAENEDLRSQIQDYVNEVKRFEEVLAMKEDERNGLLEQYKNLTVEASSLEVEKSRLESTSKNLKILLVAKETELDSTKGTMDALDRELRDQRASKLGANVQLADCKSKLEQAERELKQMSAEKASTEGDLNAVRELCTQLDLAKEQLTVQLSSVEKEKLRLLARVSDLEATVDQTRNEAQNRRKEVEYLEQQLGVRRDTELVSHRQHRDLKDELESLQTELAAMKTKLEMKAADVDHYRKESHDLQVEVEQMRLELTRARGEKRELCDELERVRRRMGTPFLSTATPMDLSPSKRTTVLEEKNGLWTPQFMNLSSTY